MPSKKQQAKQIAELQERLDAAERKNRVLTVENEQLASVCARDRKRIQSETAAYSRNIADSEGTTK